LSPALALCSPFNHHFAYPVNEQACIGCAACAMVCPDACIEVYRVVEK